MNKIYPFLWFDKEAGAAADYYVSVFKDAKILSKSVLKNTPSGDTEIVMLEIFGQKIQMMSAGPYFKLNEAFSLVVLCDDQAEIDYYWEKLSAHPESEQCGWCKDKFGVSWQIVPSVMNEMQSKGTPEQNARVTKAFLKMKKFDIAELQKAFDGK